MRPCAEILQADYYERTAALYDGMHNSDDDHEHNLALAYIEMTSRHMGLNSFLDVGARTGRGVRFLLDRGLQARGIEPVSALIQQAELSGLPAGLITQGSGYELPFADGSFDVVLECGVLHHVAKPARMVAEMIRVAKHAIFLSDSNRFGQGRYPARYLKLVLYKLGLWPAARFLQTRGKMYVFSEGDGVAYSYSVFDSYDQLAAQSKEIWLLPTAGAHTTPGRWFHPLLTSTHVLLCAFKDTPKLPHLDC